MNSLEIFKRAKRVPYFRGVFMRDELTTPRKNESLIINLDNSKGEGTHWVAVKKRGNNVLYFDPFGIQPPKEVIRYYKPLTVYYSKKKVQRLNSSKCGKHCLSFLYNKKR